MLLSVDTSTRMIGVALYDGSQVLSSDMWTSRNHHTVELGKTVAENLARVGAVSDDLSALGVALGPGSFTGLRIGLALVKGIALSQGVPVIGVPTLDVVAAAHPERDMPLAAVLQAGRGRLAVGWYDPDPKQGWQSREQLENLAPEELRARIQEPTLVSGELTAPIRKTLSENADVVLAAPARALRAPGFLAELAWKRWKAGSSDEAAVLSPIYLHRGEPIPG